MNNQTNSPLGKKRLSFRLFSSLLASVLVLVAKPATASTSGTGYISGVTQNNGNVSYFTQSGSRTTKPACATDDRWIIDTSGTAGQNLLNVMLLAYSQGRQVSISGIGLCYSGSDNELVGIVFIQP